MSAQGFQLRSPYSPAGDQPAAIAELVDGVKRGDLWQVLLGVTGSGKTFSVANVIQQLQKPTLIVAHNKTLAAQLYGEFKHLFPDNAVEYFVSYYDYFQPEAYVASSDTYIEKDSSVNEAIDRMRHAATQALLTRRDVIIVASVSCIYGIGSRDSYGRMSIDLQSGTETSRDALLRSLTDLQYTRNDFDFFRGTFRVRGDVVEIFPPNEEERAIRIEFFGDEIEQISDIDPLRGIVLGTRERAMIFPNSHYVTPEEQRLRALESIKVELQEQLQKLKKDNCLVEAQRLEQRTLYDIEMLEQLGFCTGIENYSRHMAGTQEGVPPATLIDYFPEDRLIVIDESHQTIPQIKAMYRGDRKRKETLVNYGFRLPSALDNRPLMFEEFLKQISAGLCVSATPGEWELEQTEGVIVEQVIRPTGLLDPPIEIRPVATQVDDLLSEIQRVVARGERVLVTTLTKRMAEDLSEFLDDAGVRSTYLHSDIKTLERVGIIRDLREGEVDVLVGINLLREGLDMPEVSLVAILDADKEGFLRSHRALIQTAGRAARNAAGRVIMYADRITDSMQLTIDETERRRELQHAHNVANHIVPTTVKSEIFDIDATVPKEEGATGPGSLTPDSEGVVVDINVNIPQQIATLRADMKAAAAALDFEQAAKLRDKIKVLERTELDLPA